MHILSRVSRTQTDSARAPYRAAARYSGLDGLGSTHGNRDAGTPRAVRQDREPAPGDSAGRRRGVLRRWLPQRIASRRRRQGGDQSGGSAAPLPQQEPPSGSRPRMARRGHPQAHGRPPATGHRPAPRHGRIWPSTTRPRPNSWSCTWCSPLEATAPTHPVHDYFAHRYRTVVQTFTDAFGQAAAEDQLREGVDAGSAARQLTALMDGLQVMALRPVVRRHGRRLRRFLRLQLTVQIASPKPPDARRAEVGRGAPQRPAFALRGIDPLARD